MADAEDVSQFVTEQAVPEPGEVEDDHEAVTSGLDIASEAGESGIAEIPRYVLQRVKLVYGLRWLPCHARKRITLK